MKVNKYKIILKNLILFTIIFLLYNIVFHDETILTINWTDYAKYGLFCILLTVYYNKNK